MNISRLHKIHIIITLGILLTFFCCNKSDDLSGNLPDEFSTVCKKEYFYRAFRDTIFLTLSTDSIFVRFQKDTVSFSECFSIIDKYKFLKLVSEQPPDSNHKRVTVSITGKCDCSQLSLYLEMLNSDNLIRYATPYFYYKGSSTWLGITDEITAKALPGYENNLDNLISSYGLEKVKETNIYTLIRIPEITTGMESLNLANKMMENEWMKYSTPNFIAQIVIYP